jgi:hypothetical protein
MESFTKSFAACANAARLRSRPSPRNGEVEESQHKGQLDLFYDTTTNSNGDAK